MFIVLIVLIFYYLAESTTWTLASFRRGVTVLKYSEPVTGKVSDDLLNQLLERDKVMFKFLSQDRGLFRKPISSVRRPELGFPLFGEIQLSGSIAHITVRVPVSALLVYAAFFIALTVPGSESFDFPRLVWAQVTTRLWLSVGLSAFVLLAFVVERNGFHEAFEVVKKHLQEDTHGPSTDTAQ